MPIVFKNLKKEYLVVFLMSVSVVFSGSLIAPIEQRFISSLTENSVLMGFTFALGTLSLSLIALIFARLSRTYGKNKFIIAGAAMGILYPLIYATSTNILQYMGGKMVFGFAGAAMGPLLIAYLQEHLSIEKNQGKLLGYLYSAQSIAGSFGAIFGGFVADRYFLGAPYYLQFAVLLIPFFLALKFFGRRRVETNGGLASSVEAKHSLAKHHSYLFSIKYILSKPYLVYRFLFEIPFRMMWSVEIILYPLIILSFIDSNTVIGSVFATQGVIAMIVLPFAGKLVDKRSYMTGMRWAFFLMGISTFVMAFSISLSMFWILAGLFSVGLAIGGPARGVLEIKNIESEHRAEIIAVLTIFGYLLEALSPFLAGILLTMLNPKMVLLFYALLIWLFFGIATVVLKIKLKSK
ncbi:MAG: MFS transporter [Candidatus Pacebacteria bacterium]|nr:MFS transporter [Candidatus Paceibacterota bacterium]